MSKKIKFYALTGFLGAGKTTVLKNIIDNLEGKKVGVIQNEFGKLGIDGEILRNDNIEMVEINKGSIFCSCLKLSFVEALVEMSKQEIDYLFVESSGLADPSNMQEILEAVKVLAGDVYAFSGAICLVDAYNFEEQINDIETVQRQLKHCNLALISKLDLVEDTKEDFIAKIRKINPVCRIEVSQHGKFDVGVLDEDLNLYKWAESEESLNSVENKPKTLFMNCRKDVDGEKFEMFLNDVKKHCYRLKGFFEIDGLWKQVDVVGNKIDYSECEPKEKSELVIISKIGPKVIKPVIESWVNIFGEKPELKN